MDTPTVGSSWPFLLLRICATPCSKLTVVAERIWMIIMHLDNYAPLVLLGRGVTWIISDSVAF